MGKCRHTQFACFIPSVSMLLDSRYVNGEKTAPLKKQL